MDTLTDIVYSTLFSAAEIQAAHAVPIHPAGKGPTLDEVFSNFESDHLFSGRKIDLVPS